jgi:exosome complex exonuclease DIS3/RRP44
MPSVAVLRAALPLLEDRCFPLENCVFLQSVLRVLSDALTAREYRALCKALANGFVDAHVLLNEQTQSTWVPQQSEQPAEQHLAELVKRAYQAVAQQFPDAVVLMCVVDKESDPFASILDLPVCTFEEALEQAGAADPAVVHRFEALAARIQAKGETLLRKTGAPSEYPRYLPDKEIADGLKTGRVLEGTIHVLPHNPREAEVHVEQGGSTFVYLVQGRHHMNRALNGDRVCIQVLPRAEWAVPVSQRSLTFESEPVDERDEVDVGDLLEETAATTNDTFFTATDDAMPTAKVVGCTRRQYNQYVCTILRESLTKEEGRDEYVLAIPLDKAIPKLRMRTKQVRG